MNCGCDSLASGLLDPFVARARLIEAARPIAGQQRCGLEQARGRVLAEDIVARHDMPGVDNSAMDGYALRLAELLHNESVGEGLPIVQRIPAGAGVTPLDEGSCARIFTGAPIPLGADCVIPQEATWIDGPGHLRVEGTFSVGANIRRRGEETREGSRLLAAGTYLDAPALALLATQGIAEVRVRPRLAVALISTGDELLEPGERYVPGRVYNSNRVMLQALLEQQNCEVLDLGIQPDDRESLHRALRIARDSADLVLCTGGVSVGEEDHMRPVIESMGHIDFHGLAIKPGKPFTFAWLGDAAGGGTPLIGLPGNPVASLVGWQLLGLPFVHGRQGRRPAPLQHFPVSAGFSRPASRERYELLRVVLEWRCGDPMAQLAGGQGSHMLSAASQADGYLLVSPGDPIDEGRGYAYLPISQFSV
ncbi:gephyrin-like molybdotransferase Glp [Litchfieldella xinjiangensis]|uniref:molybdopterin molybdotransferase MoeA n=1 Tax=Litchfieldella xinjiangensis TaxID=1166948 RepID=UPI0005BA2B32|nr:gephyrin-like molybdotransferase Glp [Halomonas xinjiangensis]